ncbi:MAG: DnaB-like helicase C-terminal domain-containing protein [Gordonia amarae]
MAAVPYTLEIGEALAPLDAIAPESLDVAPRTTGADVVALLTLARFILAKAVGADGQLPPAPWLVGKTRNAGAEGPPDGVHDELRRCDEWLTSLREESWSRGDEPGSELFRTIGDVGDLVSLAIDAFQVGSSWTVERLDTSSPLASRTDQSGATSGAVNAEQVWATVFYLRAMHVRARTLLDLGYLEEAKETCDQVFAEYRSFVRYRPESDIRREYLVVALRFGEILAKQDRVDDAVLVLSDLIRRCWRYPELDWIARQAVRLQDDLSFDPEAWYDEFAMLERELDVEYLIGIPHDLWDAYDRGTDLESELVRIGAASPDESDDTDEERELVEAEPETLRPGQVLGMLSHQLGARQVPDAIESDDRQQGVTDEEEGSNVGKRYTSSLLDELHENPASKGAIPTGFRELDEALRGGLHCGSLTVIASHAGVGSSTLALGIARNAAVSQGVVTNYLSLDSTARGVTRRVVSAEAGVKLSELETMDVDPRDTEKLSVATNLVSAAPLTIGRVKDRASDAVLALIENDTWGYGATLTVLDPLNFLGTGTVLSNCETSPELQSNVMADFGRRLKMIAVDNEIAVILVVSVPLVTAPPAESGDWAEDFYALGPVAQAADNVLLLYRPDRWDREDPRGGEADILVAKGLGFPWTFTVATQLHLARFVDLCSGTGA